MSRLQPKRCTLHLAQKNVIRKEHFLTESSLTVKIDGTGNVRLALKSFGARKTTIVKLKERSKPLPGLRQEKRSFDYAEQKLELGCQHCKPSE